MKRVSRGRLIPGVKHMKRKTESGCRGEELRVDPEQRLCPKFDSTSIALFPTAEPGDMGFRVLDDCAEEHIM